MQRLRERKGLTQGALAKQVGCHPNTLSRWENGDPTTCPGLDDASEIAKALGVTLSELVGEKTTDPIPLDRTEKLFFAAAGAMHAVRTAKTIDDVRSAVGGRVVAIDPDDVQITREQYVAIHRAAEGKVRKLGDAAYADTLRGMIDSL